MLFRDVNHHCYICIPTNNFVLIHCYLQHVSLYQYTYIDYSLIIFVCNVVIR